MNKLDYMPSYIEVNKDNLIDNLQNQMKILPEDATVFAVVKANAYGHGMVEVAKLVLEHGVNGLCVATLNEAAKLREAGISAPVLVLGITPYQYAQFAADNDISLTVGDLPWLEKAEVNNLKIHLSIDSGMGRIGFRKKSDLLKACEFIENNTNKFTAEGIYTHFSTADSPDDSYFQIQRKRFNEMISNLPIDFKYIHCANSATALWHKDIGINMVRFGIGLYGLNPSGTDITELPYKQKPALSLYSSLAFVKSVPAGEKIGYGATYTTSEEEWIGTVSMGYSDGWLRRMSGFDVLVDGQRCPIVGRICMNQFMIKLPHEVPVGSKVTLIGTDGNETITATDAAAYSGTINYEILCSLAEHLPRIYK
ncbi:alanine racemase [Companilactobacillus metriopterae]|uniref:alanine racemase n=1 Tax=Companilactobacillus metriopterae TaxID=1909267 RepID=UPI00100A4DD2|nr:alanine racemase [Companilactobacillus metriopterae]